MIFRATTPTKIQILDVIPSACDEELIPYDILRCPIRIEWALGGGRAGQELMCL